MQIAEYTDTPKKLNRLDIEILARNLAAQVIYECLQTGYFEKDVQMFSENDQERIRKQLELLAKRYDLPQLPEEE